MIHHPSPFIKRRDFSVKIIRFAGGTRKRPEDRDHAGAGRQPQFLRQVVLGAGPGDRDIQAEQVSLRLPPGDVLGKPGSVIVHADELLFNEQSEIEKEM